MSASTNTPAPGTGPDPTLNLTDPSTWAMILSAIAAFVAVLWPGHDVTPLVQGLATLGAAIVSAVVIGAKHDLAGKLALAPQLLTEVSGEVKSIEGQWGGIAHPSQAPAAAVNAPTASTSTSTTAEPPTTTEPSAPTEPLQVVTPPASTPTVTPPPATNGTLEVRDAHGNLVGYVSRASADIIPPHGNI